MPHDSTARFLRFRDHGDLAALGAVFDEVAPKLLGLALHLCGQAADAEDLVQRSFVVAIEKAASFDATRAVGRWLTGILTKEAQNLRRQRERRVEAGARIDPRAVEPDCVGASDAAATIEARELVEILRTRVDALPEEQRQVLLLQVQHGLSPVEIAEALGLAPGTVRMRLHRGLRALRKLLPQGLAPSLPVLFEGRGLARVREAVLAAGRREVATVAATALWITPSLWIMKNALVVFVGLVCTLLFFVGRSLFVQSPPSEATSTPVSAGAEVDGTSGTASSPNTSTADEGTRQANPATNAKAAVRVRLLGHVRDAARQEGDDVLLPGADVTLWRSPRDSSQVEVIAARAQTSAIAPLRFDALDPGAYRIRVHFATRLQHEAICELVAGREEQVDVEVTIFGR
ncbi:MAG TPA: RNA polymerase sigma factor, partial [Planctomycetota bacterium]|nr:RNA polymerase sigma factor [Planctomycetota bacterium]